MTSNQDKVTAVINNPKYGTQVVIENVTNTLNDYGDPTSTITATSTVYGIMYSLVDENGNYIGAGQQQEGEMQLIITADTVIDVEDFVTYNSKQYKVLRKLTYPLGGSNLANQVLLKELI